MPDAANVFDDDLRRDLEDPEFAAEYEKAKTRVESAARKLRIGVRPSRPLQRCWGILHRWIAEREGYEVCTRCGRSRRV